MLIQVSALNSGEWIFPTLECIHIVGFATLVGTIAIVDFRLLGARVGQESPAQALKNTSAWTLLGLTLILLSGPLMFATDPDMYYLNLAFLFKMAALVLAIIFNYTIHRKVALAGASPGTSKLVAIVSMLLWAAVVFGGIFIGFVNEGLNFS